MKRKARTQENLNFNSAGDFSDWIKDFAKKLSTKEIIVLSGDLGVGKTFFVNALVHARQGTDHDLASSPSFAIHNHYETKIGPIEHFDLYRLESEEDLESTGFWDTFQSERAVIVIEWGERIPLNDYPELWPLTVIKIDFVNGDRKSSQRDVSISRY